MARMSAKAKLGAMAERLGHPWKWDGGNLWYGDEIAYRGPGAKDAPALRELTAIARAVLAVVDKEQ